MKKQRIAVFGKGRIGTAAAFMLREAGYPVELFDDEEWDNGTLDSHDVWLACTPFAVCEELSVEALLRRGKLYFDLTEDVATGKAIRNVIGKPGDSIFVPHCGVAPGAVSIIAGSFGPAHRITMRVGALPITPTGRLKYALNWSTNGLVNEYIQTCVSLHEGQRVEREPLIDEAPLADDRYESFSTSGGIGTFCDTRIRQVANAKYQTIRYAGHIDYIRFLLEDMKLTPFELEQLLDATLPRNEEDKVIIDVYCQKTQFSGSYGYSRTVYSGGEHYPDFSAIQQTTAAGVVAVMQWVLDHRIEAVELLRDGSWIANEDIPLTGVEQYDCWKRVFGTYLRGLE